MITRFLCWSVVGICALLSSACVVPGDGYGYGYGYDGGANVGFGVDYYGPFGGDYGGWSPGYRVGPVRDGDHRRDRRDDRASPRGYRPAPMSHAMPSIPSRSRSPGGSRSQRR